MDRNGEQKQPNTNHSRFKKPKKLNGSSSWKKQMLESLAEIEPEQAKPSEHKRETAKRLRADKL